MDAVSKELRVMGSWAILNYFRVYYLDPDQEFELQGGNLQGPAAQLRVAGNYGRWPSNIYRDIRRKIGSLAT